MKTARRPKTASAPAGWLGWNGIADDEIRAAERSAASAGEGVRDELGLAHIHFLYADRFFPGTSVQMTKLRYVFFVAATYESLRSSAHDGFPDEQLPFLEWDTASQLKKHHRGALEGSGIIGWTIVQDQQTRGSKPKQLPSMSYWTALTHWNILNHDYGWPVRSAVHAEWKAYTRRKLGRNDVENIRRKLFCDELEELWPADMSSDLQTIGKAGAKLDFKLMAWERTFLRKRLETVKREDGKASLLSRIAKAGNAPELLACSDPWDEKILNLVDDDADERAALLRARQASALVQICNAAYSVLVARKILRQNAAQNVRDLVSRTQENLNALCHRDSPTYNDARKLVIDDIRRDQFDPSSWERATPWITFLKTVQTWMIANKDISTLTQHFALRETQAKRSPGRARLCHAKDLRKEWLQQNLRTSPEPRRTDYRWNIASALLRELTGVTK